MEGCFSAVPGYIVFQTSVPCPTRIGNWTTTAEKKPVAPKQIPRTSLQNSRAFEATWPSEFRRARDLLASRQSRKIVKVITTSVLRLAPFGCPCNLRLV